MPLFVWRNAPPALHKPLPVVGFDGWKSKFNRINNVLYYIDNFPRWLAQHLKYVGLQENVPFINPTTEDIMKKQMLTNGIVVATVVFILGYGANAFAGWGRGSGYGGCGGPGGRWGGGYGAATLSPEQTKQMESQRQAFFDDTADLRQEIYQKDLDLRRELAKETPDAAKAKDLQKALSQLEAQLDAKRIDHMMAMRKINPEAGRGRHGWGGKGPGYRNCPGAGGGARCW